MEESATSPGWRAMLRALRVEIWAILAGSLLLIVAGRSRADVCWLIRRHSYACWPLRLLHTCDCGIGGTIGVLGEAVQHGHAKFPSAEYENGLGG